MRKLVVLFFACFVLSCQNADKPHLPPAKMQQVLSDIHLAEVYSIVIRKDSLHRGNERNHDSLATYYSSVLHHHGVSLPEFEQSLEWYKQHPEEMDSIYARMIPEMTKLDDMYK